MVFHSVNYVRNFFYDFPTESKNERVMKLRNIGIAALPVLSSYGPLRPSLNIGLGSSRALSQLFQSWEALKGNKKIEMGYYLLQSCLSVTSVALSILHPIRGNIVFSVSDIIEESKDCLIHLREENYAKFFGAFARLVLGILYLGTICYGSIELTVALMALQIVLGCYESVSHFKKGELLEGLLKTLSTGIHIRQAIPQIKLLHWKNTYQPTLEAILKQDSKGFVYLDIQDEDLKSLYAAFKQAKMELPPYFSPGMAGAHVSVILGNEARAGGIKVAEVGQKFTFRIAEVISLKPESSSLSKVWFLTLTSPEMDVLRVRYGLTPRIHGDHDFHLTFAIEK